MPALSSLPLSPFVFHSYIFHRLDRSSIVLASAATEVIQVLLAFVSQSSYVDVSLSVHTLSATQVTIILS